MISHFPGEAINNANNCLVFKKASFSVEYANTILYSIDRRFRESI